MFKKMVLATLLTVTSLASQAEFNLPGSGVIRFPTGTETPLNFGFSFTQSQFGYAFTAGKQEMDVSQLPEKYSIWLGLNKDNLVYVQEFAPAYFTEFEWFLDENSIVLEKKVLSPKRSVGDYVLTINNISYFFKGKQGSIDLYFNDQGIKEIETTGFVKDIGMSE
ncbi:hypothetical protein [Planctobacterium marinum]|uniref:Uncharacterized protein n=1 Tax=Planctobacterium marinum TaxID=1631968 RepID=A0AA48KV35_9ALTE|nr:hypothetical protein MACH26_26210 [Planctobacterium marinum]